ncbi:MAG: hypothetical protein R3C05_15485 [Pirellulaceae bacterium]
MNRIVVTAVAFLASASILFAQDPFAAPPAGDDVFGMPAGGAADGTPFGAVPAPAAAAATDEPITIPDPLVVELQRYAQGNNERLGLAIQGAVRISDWEEAASYVDILGARQLSDADYADIVNAVRPNYLLRLQQHPSLTDAQRGIIGKALVAAQRHAEDRARLQAAIARLGSEQESDRLEAVAAIRSGGLASIAELVAAYVAPNPPAPRERIFGVLRRFGDETVGPLHQVALHGPSDSRSFALQALAELDLAGSMPDFVAAYHDASATEAERRVAGEAMLQRLRGLPSVGEAEIYLGRQLERAMRQTSRVLNDAKTVRMWRLDDEKKVLQWDTVPLSLAFSRDAADAASRYGRLPVTSAGNSVAREIAYLSYRLLVDPEFGTAADYQEFVGPEDESAQRLGLLRLVLSEAIEQKNEYAAIAAIRLCKHSSDRSLVQSNGATRQLMVDVSLHPSPRVRYEAALAVAKLDPRFAYSGSSEVLHRWIEMTKLQRRPTALILEARKHLVDEKLSWLEQFGYRVEVVTSVADLLRRIEIGGDIQVLVAGSQPYDRSIIETVDLIRRRPLGGAFPILIYCQPEKTLWDEDLREPVRDRSGKIIVEVAGSESAAAAAEDALAEPFQTGLPRVSRTEVQADTSLARRFQDLRAKHRVQEERLRLNRDLGNRWTAPLAVVEVISSSPELAQMIRDLQAQLPMPGLLPAERLAYADAGIRLIEALAESNDPNNPYDFRSHEQELTSAVQAGGFSEAGLRLLSSFGTPSSQLTLANLADSVALPLPKRQAAAEALAASIGRFGTRIDRQSVAEQYDRYNETADPAAQAALGIILDAMEQRAEATTR